MEGRSGAQTGRSAGAERRRRWPLYLGFASASALLMFTYRYLDRIAREDAPPFLDPFIEEVTGVYGAALMIPAIAWAARRWRLDGRAWYRAVPAHAVALTLLSAAHTTFNWLAREALFPLAGLGDYDYGIMSVRYAMELPADVIIYMSALAFVYLIDRWRAAREHELRASQLATRLVEAQLHNLRTQLDPHFLFNALNTVSSVMYEDVRAADGVLARLSDLLRRTMHANGGQEVPLREELEVLELYLDIMRARFQEGLDVEICVPPDVEDAQVPNMLLQPLVENALRHGLPAPPRPARVEVRVQRAGATLRLAVHDNGPGPGAPIEELLGRGIGLSNTVERLRRLYGAAGRVDVSRREAGGCAVAVELPYRVADAGGAVGRGARSAAPPPQAAAAAGAALKRTGRS